MMHSNFTYYPVGTKSTPMCKNEKHHPDAENYTEIICEKNGEWNAQPFKCKPGK